MVKMTVTSLMRYISLVFLCAASINLEASKSGSHALELTGDILQIALPATALSTTLVLHDYEGSIQFLKALGATEVTAFGLKYTVHEKRPGGCYHSFPSGHTALAFVGAGFIQRRYGWKYGVPAYAAASVVGYSRCNTRAHWTHDVLAGAAIGILYNLIFTTPYQGRMCFQPVVTSNSFALQYDHNF